MAIPVIVSRVRATLHKQNYQGFTKDQILDAAKALGINSDNPTAEDTKAVANYLIQSLSEKESNTNDDNALIVPTPMTEEETVNTTMLESLPIPEVTREVEQPKEETAITHTEKVLMVGTQAKILGIELSTTEAESIANQINFHKSDTDEMLEEIKNFLIAFINHREAQNQQQVLATFGEIIQHANASNQRVSEALSSQFQSLSFQLEESRNHFKSSVRSALKCFAIVETQA
jgi:hypothetical protein